MAETDNWETEKFNEIFDDELRVLQRRKVYDTTCSIEDLQGILNSLYILEGNGDKSRVQEISLSASIAAYEQFINSWKNEIETADKIYGKEGL